MTDQTPHNPSELTRLAQGAKPISRRSSPFSNTALAGPRFDSLTLPNQLLRAGQAGVAPTEQTSVARPAQMGRVPRNPEDIAKVGSTTQVDAHSRVMGTAIVPIVSHARRTPDKKSDRPVFEVSAEGKKRAAEDIRLWGAWREASGKVEKRKAFRALMGRFEGMIQKVMNSYRPALENSTMPPSAFELEIRTQVARSLRSYDPSKGQINTWLSNSALRAVGRFMKENQNVARVPEDLINKKGKVDRARVYLEDDLGRAPTDQELAKHLRIRLRDVQRIAEEFRLGLSSGAFSDPEADPATMTRSKVEEYLALIEPELTDKEKVIYQILVEAEQKRNEAMIQPAALMGRTGFSASEVSRIKKGITAKLMRHLGRELKD